MVTTKYNSARDMINKLQEMKSQTKIIFIQIFLIYMSK